MRARRKENIPPHLSCRGATPGASYQGTIKRQLFPHQDRRSRHKEASAGTREIPDRARGMSHGGDGQQRSIQKNVNVDLLLDSSKDVAISRHGARAAVLPSSGCERATAFRKPEVATPRGAKPHRRVLVQTNLSCPYRPFRDTPGRVTGGSSWQQSNLKTRWRSLENVAGGSDPPCPCTVDLGSGNSGWDPVSLESCPENNFSGGRKCRGQKPAEALGHCGAPCSCSEISWNRIGNKDPHILKHPRGCCCRSGGRSYRTLGTAGDCSCPTELYERPFAGSFLRGQCLHFESPSGSFSSSRPGPALTLDHLRCSASAESHAASATLRVLLESSQVSADLHSSIRHLKHEAASMGALSSFPGEPKAFPLPSPLRLDPRVSSLGRPPSATEQLGGEESCAKQASVKWRNSFARDWGLDSTTTSAWEALHPSGCGCRNAGLYTHSVEALDRFWPPASWGGVRSTSLVCQGEEGCVNSSFCHFGSYSPVQRVLERKGPSSHRKTQQKMLDPKELSSRFFHRPELGYGETFEGLEVSLETWHARPPVNVGVTVDSAHGEVHVTVRSPEGDELDNSSKYLHDLQDEETEGADGALPTPQAVDKSVLFLPTHDSLEEVAGKSLGAHSSAAVNSQGPTGFEGTASVSENPRNGDCWPDARHDQGEESPTGKNATSSKFPRCEESHHGMDAVQKEMSSALGRKVGPMDRERSRVTPQSTLLLASYFNVWRNQVFAKKAAAQALYEQQLLRKGLGALKWAVELQRAQAGIAQQRHSRSVLAAHFHRWQGTTVKRQKERASQVETETPNQDSPAVLRGEKIVKGPILHQLSMECLEAAAQYGRAEGNLWLQIHIKQEGDKLDRKAQAVRDMRHLAAFRLWCLQKERLAEEESRARDACALLAKRRVRSAFEVWRSRYRATERISHLAAQIQRRLLSRCFIAWKGCAERKACARCCLDHQRVRALRLCFQQWAWMVQVWERDRKTLLELLTQRQRIAYARFGFALNAPKTQPHLNVVRQFRRNGADTLDGLYIALALQETFYIWKARWCQQRRLDAFCQAAEQKRLAEALSRWRCKALHLSPSRRCTGDLGSLDSDEYSMSSGFHSNTPALPAFSDSLEREASLMGCSPGSISSLATLTDASYLLQRLSPSPLPSPDREDLGDEAVESWTQASSPLRNRYSGTGSFVRGPFVRDPFPECGIRSITASPSASPGDEKEIFENQRQLLARCFALWSSWTLQNLKGKQIRRRSLLSWAFISWSVAAARTSMQRKAQAWLESRRQQRLLASCFARWKAELQRAQQQREEEQSLRRRRPTRHKATWRWRKAVRGFQAVRLSAGSVVQQSCNYWTKAASFHLCLRERSSLIGAPKFVKMPLSWPTKQRRNRKEGLPAHMAVCARLNGSAFHVWLVVYRSQSRMVGSSLQGPPDSLGRAEWRVGPAEIRSSSAEMDSTRWLWRKYLRLWRHNVLLHRFREAWRMRRLVRAWLLWKDTCQAEWVVQALARHRRALQGWMLWRRRYLQTQVAEHFLEAQDRTLLKRAFGRWRDLAAEANSQPQGNF